MSQLKLNKFNASMNLFLVSAGNGAHKTICGVEVLLLDDINFEVIDYFFVTALRHHCSLRMELIQRLNKIRTKALVIDLFADAALYSTSDIVVNPAWANNEKSEKEFVEAIKPEWIEEVNHFALTAFKNIQLFEYIEIETINRCNGVCSFCPVNKNKDIRPIKYMDVSLFNRIISGLADLNYVGCFSLFSNNEPLLDERIVEFSRLAREKLPNARIHMYTNGTLLTLDKFIALIPCVDELIIDNYHKELKLIKTNEIVAKYVEEHGELRDKVTIVLRKPDEILTSRGGDAPNRHHFVSFKKDSCALLFSQFIVRPDGKVSLCCNDSYGKITLGDLTNQTIEEVWFGEKYKAVRELIIRGRENIELCKFCDTFNLCSQSPKGGIICSTQQRRNL